MSFSHFISGLTIILTWTSSVAFANETEVGLFAQLPAMAGPQLSPDGKRIAFLSPLKGRYNLVIEQFNPEFKRSILDVGDDLDLEWVRWANDDKLVISAAYTAKRFVDGPGGGVLVRETRLLSVDTDGKNLKSIIRPATRTVTGSRVPIEMAPPQLQDQVIDWLIDDPDHILVALDADFNNADEVRRVDINDGGYKTVANDRERIQWWLTDSSGEVRLGWCCFNENPSAVYRKPNGEWVEHFGGDWLEEGFYPRGFAEDPNLLLVQGPNEAGLDVVRKLNLETGEFVETVFEHEQFDAHRVVRNGFGNAPVGVSYIEHEPKVQYFDPAWRKMQATIDKALPGTKNRIASTSKNQRQVLIFSYSDTSPGKYSLWDRDGKTLSHYSDYIKKLGAELLSPVSATSYTARDGMEIPAYLTIPRGAESKNLSAVVLPHGGPRARDDKTYWFLSQFLAARGYVVLQPNFRGSSGYGNTFAEAGQSEWGGKMQDDVTDGAQWLIDEGIADPDRICIVGWSYGGYAAAMGAVKTPDLYRCAASINGVLDLPAHIALDLRYFGGREWTRHMGLDGERSKAVSPFHQAEKIKVPMLIVQATDDQRVHSQQQGHSFSEQLKKLGKPVEFVEIAAGGHSIENEDGRKKLLRSLDRFLAKNIGAAAN